LEAESLFHAIGLTTNLAPTLEQLTQLAPTTLALMHGSSFTEDGGGQLLGLADGYAAMAGSPHDVGASLQSLASLHA
jgi:hypothetical protein